ncbi:hypothetical protein AB0C77_20185 [Streptomyces sp. NPDC048629]|uniref:hypothetical protein n=1 Tax=Streptomyces sp. NPDC048629 TaxID=3154824 RepID=UPI003434A9AA
MTTPLITLSPTNPNEAHYDFVVGAVTLAADLAEIGRQGWQVSPTPMPLVVDGKALHRYTLHR